MASHFQKKLIAIAVCSASAWGMSGTAVAQEKNVQPEERAPEELVVTGIRASVASAQEIKRESDTVKDVVTAEDMGALPDKSVTEVLQRVPGVTIERFESSTDPNHFSSEGSGVVVRGLKRVRSEINGREAFSSNSTGGGLSYADIPGELLGRVEVVKNTTADLIAGGVAGTVNLVTRKPLDSKKMVIYGSIEGTYGDYREELTPVATFAFSNVWDTGIGDVGFLIGGTKSEYKDRGDGIGIANYYERSGTAMETEWFGKTGTAIPGRENETLFTPAGIAVRTSDADRERSGLVTSAQWRNPDETLEVTLEHVFSDSSRVWDERVVNYGEEGYLINPKNIGVVTGIFDSEGFMQGGELNTNWLNNASRHADSGTKINDSGLHIKYTPLENLELDFDYQHVNSANYVEDFTYTAAMYPTMGAWYKNDGVTNRPAKPINNTGVEFDLSGDVPKGINFTGNPSNPVFNEQSFMRSKMDHTEDNEANLDAFAFDLKYTFEDNWLSSAQAGTYSSRKEQLSHNSAYNWGEVGGPWSNRLETSYLKHPELFEAHTFKEGTFFGGGHLKGDQTFLFPRFDDVRNFNAFGESIVGISAKQPNLNQRPGAVNGYLPSEITETSEDRFEAYIRANYEFSDLDHPVKGNVGLRYVEWQVESEGGVLFPKNFAWDEQGTAEMIKEHYPDAFAFANGAQGARTTVKGDKYSKVLPSFNLSVSVHDDLILRFAASKNVFFPTFSNFQNFKKLASSRVYDFNAQPGELSVTSINFSGQTGNPNIKPEEAAGADVSLEWYVSDTSSLNFSLFRKDLKNIIRKRLYTENTINPVPYNGGDNVQSVDYQTDTNEGSGTISGYEISYTQFYDSLPGYWGGLGLSVNYTFIAQTDLNDEKSFGEGSTGEGGRNSFRAFKNLDLPGYSTDVFNFALLYEKEKISGRLAYSWRSDYLLTARDSGFYAPVFAKATGQLDGSIRYRITDNFKIGFEASNLLDEVIKTELMYNQDGKMTPGNYFKTDRRFGISASYSF